MSKDKKQQPSTKKKLSLLSTIMLVVGASIGSGIYYKNAEILGNVQNSIVLAMMSWLVALIAIFAMAMTLVEICSANKTANDEGIVGWVKTFCHKYFYQASKNFMSYIYLPINFFCMAVYGVQSIQHAVGALNPGFSFQWWLTMLISLGACTWFILMSGLSTKAANIQNWIITCVKFIPLVIAFVIGYILLGTGTISAPVNPPLPTGDTTAHPFFGQLNPGLGMFASIPAIFFAFDGFYSTASYQGQMKEPKKISSALGLGLAIVSVVNVGVSLSLMLCSKDGTIAGITWLHEHPWTLVAIYTMITFGVFGIINAYGLYTGIYYGALIKTKGIIGWKAFDRLAKGNEKLAGVLYSLVISLAVIVIFTLIGQFGYLNTGHYGVVEQSGHWVQGGSEAYLYDTAKLISFADLTANWTSLFAFVFIIFAIVGCLKNRKTNKVKVEKSKLFVPCAWISIIILSLAMLYLVVASFADVGLTVSYYINADASYKDAALTNMIGKIVTLVLLFVFVGIMAIEPIHTHRIEKKHNLKVAR